jgi:hypothetical protein
MPPAPPGDTEGNQSYKIEGMPSRCLYMHSLLPITQFFNHNAFAKDSKRGEDVIPDLLSTICCVEIPLSLILKMTIAFWANLRVRTRID